MGRDYAFTLQVPAGCVITTIKKTGLVIRFRDLTFPEQITFLKLLMSEGIFGMINYEYTIEFHKDGRQHMHGRMLDCSPEHMRTKQVDINVKLGYSMDNKKLFLYKHETDPNGWRKYMYKCQTNSIDLNTLDLTYEDI